MNARHTALTASVALLVLLLTATGSGYVLLQYRHLVSTDGATVEVNRMRNGTFALLDVIRAHEAVEAVLQNGHLNGRDGEKLFKAADFLFVRLESFRSELGSTPSRSGTEAASQIGELVATLDAMMATPDEIAVDRDRLRATLKDTTTALALFHDDQKHLQVRAIERQSQLLPRLVQTTAVTIGILLMFALGAIALWRSEMMARMRRKEAEDRANQLAYYDSLTGLPNRAHFMRSAARMMARQTSPAIFLIDLDEFKIINDTHGHHIGDAVLRLVAARLSAAFSGRNGIAARLGGDEFAAMLPDAENVEKLERFIADLIETVGVPEMRDGVEVAPHVSIGVARTDALSPSEPPSLEAMMRAADYALYEAKSAGRFTGRIYDQDMARQIAERRTLKQAMPTAMVEEEFSVEYQPQFDLTTGRLRSFEALARWKHNGANVPADVFVAIAEEDDFILRLDSWVLREAVSQAATWNEFSRTPIGISVNVSARNFRSPDLVPGIRLALEGSVLPPELLTLEIRESVLIDNWSNAPQILNELCGLGVRVALDDFGTGVSSLSYLNKLRINEIKIDRSLVAELESSDRARMMLDVLVDISDALGMTLTVEGLETEAQVDLVRDLGGDVGQGYHFSWPVTAKEARKIVLSGMRVRAPESAYAMQRTAAL